MDILRKFIKKITVRHGIKTYAQYGEDVLVQGIFSTLGMGTPRYIDIGTHHATNLSNTYFFYRRGSHGVCIEPSPILAQHIKSARPRDIVRAVGVGGSNKDPVPYYILTAQTMNTFSKKDAQQTIRARKIYGDQKIESVITVPIIHINDILKEYASEYGDFVSIDTEGMDEEIVRAIDFTKYRPLVFCIETISQNEDGTFYKNKNIHAILEKNGYMEYADTYVNTIFVDKKIWDQKSYA